MQGHRVSLHIYLHKIILYVIWILFYSWINYAIIILYLCKLRNLLTDMIFYTQVVDNVCWLIYNNIISKNTLLHEVYLFYRYQIIAIIYHLEMPPRISLDVIILGIKTIKISLQNSMNWNFEYSYVQLFLTPLISYSFIKRYFKIHQHLARHFVYYV